MMSEHGMIYGNGPVHYGPVGDAERPLCGFAPTSLPLTVPMTNDWPLVNCLVCKMRRATGTTGIVYHYGPFGPEKGMLCGSSAVNDLSLTTNWEIVTCLACVAATPLTFSELQTSPFAEDDNDGDDDDYEDEQESLREQVAHLSDCVADLRSQLGRRISEHTSERVAKLEAAMPAVAWINATDRRLTALEKRQAIEEENGKGSS